MKKIIALLMAAALVSGTAACKSKNVTESDMNRVEGEALNTVEENATNEEGESADTAEVSIGNFDVAIRDAKLIENDGSRIIIISYEFTNNTTKDESFDGIFAETVMQGDQDLFGTSLTDVEGFDPLSATTLVSSGSTAVAQKAYKLRDDETDVSVSVYKYSEPNLGIASKTFSVKF